jgi:hypothetical protein
MKNFLFGFLFLLTACATTQTTVMKNTTSLPDLGIAPELTNEAWLNTDAPLRLADLRGKVIAIDMWTFG